MVADITGQHVVCVDDQVNETVKLQFSFFVPTALCLALVCRLISARVLFKMIAAQ